MALLIGIAKENVCDVRHMYEFDGKKIFTKRGFFDKGLQKSTYHPKGMEDVVHEHVPEGCRMDSVDRPKPLVFVTATLGTEPFLLRNYEPNQENPQQPGSSNATVCESARATSAAPWYFQPAKINDRIFLDGGLVANNPTDLAYWQAIEMWKECPIECIVSLGCGDEKEVETPEKTGLSSELGSFFGELATTTKRAHNRVANAVQSGRDAASRQLLKYFRLNPKMSRVKPVDLDSTQKEDMEYLRMETEEFIANTPIELIQWQDLSPPGQPAPLSSPECSLWRALADPAEA